MDDPATTSVLVLEDEHIIAMDLENMLGQWGFTQARIARDAGDARTALANGGVDLLIADFRLGREDTSADLVAEAHSLGSAVIVLTGQAIEPETLARMGSPTVIEKPVQSETLREALMNALERA